MKRRYQEECGFEIDEASDVAIRLRVLAGEIYNMQTTLEWTKRQFFPETAAGEYLDHLARQRGMERRPAAKAKGTLTFSVDTPLSYALTIPAGTVVATDSEIPVRLVTTEDASLPAANYSVAVPAEAELSGYSGNVLTGMATVFVSVPSAISHVTNAAAFRGGRDEEDDTALRERLRENMLAPPNGMNAGYYCQLALSVDGVEKAGVVNRFNGDGTAKVFVHGSTGAVSDEVLAEVRRVVREQGCLGAQIDAGKAITQLLDLEIYVTPRIGFTMEDVTVLLTGAFEQYIYSIPIGGRFCLSALGKHLLETGCIDNYEYEMTMSDMVAGGSTCFLPGDVTIGVIQT